MPMLIMLAKLKHDADRGAYERWVAEIDRPTVLTLPSIDEWRLYRVGRALGGGAEAPWDYVEVALVGDVEQLERDLRSDIAVNLTAALLEFCEPPTFLLTEQVA